MCKGVKGSIIKIEIYSIYSCLYIYAYCEAITVLQKLTYDTTQNWAYKQAHLNGMRQAYKEMMKLTDFLN